MEYKIIKDASASNVWKDNKKQSWNYIDVKTMKALYPDGGYHLVGDLYKKQRNSGSKLVDDNGCEISVTSLKSSLRVNEKVIGYVCATDENGDIVYIRIIKEVYSYIFLLVLLLIPSLFLGYKALDSNKTIDLDNSAISYHIEGLENKDPDNISIPLFGEIKVDKNMKVKMNLANPKGNPCYFKYSIILKENDKTVYESGLVQPATAIPGYTLNTKLKKGSYPGKIIVKTFSLKNADIEMNGGEIDVTVIVE